MGKRGRKRRSTRDSSSEPPIYKVPNDSEKPDILKIQNYKEEMGDALRKICKEYFCDFVKLKERKLAGTVEYDYMPDYRLTVDKHYRK